MQVRARTLGCHARRIRTDVCRRSGGRSTRLHEYAAAHHLPGPAPVAARHHGGLYRISGHGRVAYLVGTVHVGEPSLYPMAPEAERAPGTADHVVVELDTRAMGDFARTLDRHAATRRR